MRLDANHSCGHRRKPPLTRAERRPRVGSPKDEPTTRAFSWIRRACVPQAIIFFSAGKKAGSLVDRNARIARTKTAVIDGAVTLTGLLQLDPRRSSQFRVLFVGRFVGITLIFLLRYWFLVHIVRSGADEEARSSASRRCAASSSIRRSPSTRAASSRRPATGCWSSSRASSRPSLARWRSSAA